MTEVGIETPVSPENVLKKLRTSELKSLAPVVEDLSWLNDAHEIPDDDITSGIFRNNKLSAEFFFKRKSALQIQVFQDPHDEQNAYVVTSKQKKLVTILKTLKRNLIYQIDMPAQSLYISDPTLKKALNVSSLLPKNNQTVRYAMIAYPRSPDEDKQKRSAFGFDAQSNTMAIDQIVDEKTLITCCHEIGHIWAAALEIDKSTNEKDLARANKYNLEKDSWDTMKKGVSEVLFSERIANIIGRIIAEIILKSGVFSDTISSLFYTEWKDAQEAKYDEHYLEPVIAKYPQLAGNIKRYFISRLNRTKR